MFSVLRWQMQSFIVREAEKILFRVGLEEAPVSLFRVGLEDAPLLQGLGPGSLGYSQLLLSVPGLWLPAKPS